MVTLAMIRSVLHRLAQSNRKRLSHDVLAEQAVMSSRTAAERWTAAFHIWLRNAQRESAL